MVYAIQIITKYMFFFINLLESLKVFLNKSDVKVTCRNVHVFLLLCLLLTSIQPPAVNELMWGTGWHCFVFLFFFILTQTSGLQTMQS